MHTHIQCFIQSGPSMINEIYPSLKGSLDLLFTKFRELSSGVIVLHSKDVAPVRLDWGQTRPGLGLRRTNFLEIAIICEFWLSITNMCDMSHRDRGEHWTTTVCLCLLSWISLLASKNVTRLAWAPGVSVTSKISDGTRSHWSQWAKCNFSIVNKHMSAGPRPPPGRADPDWPNTNNITSPPIPPYCPTIGRCQVVVFTAIRIIIPWTKLHLFGFQ